MPIGGKRLYTQRRRTRVGLIIGARKAGVAASLIPGAIQHNVCDYDHGTPDRDEEGYEWEQSD
jgi:hypothetical protein